MQEQLGIPHPEDASHKRNFQRIPTLLGVAARQHRPTIALAVIFFLAVGCFWAGMHLNAPSKITAKLKNQKVSDTNWNDVVLYSETGVGTTILIGIGVGLFSYLIAEVVVTFIKQNVRSQSEARFVAFFGRDSLSRAERGRIILQADRFERLVEELTGESSPTASAVTAALNLPKNNRLFKARRLVNARDAEGAKIIREELRKQKFPTPELKIIEHQKGTADKRDPFEEFLAAPYVISMGLGFTETTKAVVKEIGLTIDTTDSGDAIVIPRKGTLWEYDNLRLESVEEKDKKEAKYARVFPKDWDRDKWERGEADVKDYAVIIRHTARVGKGEQTRFVLAGFTEDGTVAAGRYFALRWDNVLWDIYSKSRKHGTGNFLAIISGLSTSSNTWPGDPDITIYL
jgi:hypothetical protein